MLLGTTAQSSRPRRRDKRQRRPAVPPAPSAPARHDVRPAPPCACPCAEGPRRCHSRIEVAADPHRPRRGRGSRGAAPTWVPGPVCAARRRRPFARWLRDGRPRPRAAREPRARKSAGKLPEDAAGEGRHRVGTTPEATAEGTSLHSPIDDA